MKHTKQTRTGSLTLTWDEDTGILLVEGKGHVGPALVRWDLQHAEAIGRTRPGGWWYVVDTSRVWLPNPLNLPLLRRISKLPNISGYVVVAPSRLLRLLARAMSPLAHPDAIVRDVASARSVIEAQRR